MESVLFLATILAMIGAYLNSIGKWQGFLVWILTNTIFCIHNFLIDEWQQSLLFLFYFFIALNGLRVAEKNYKEKKEYDPYMYE